MSIFKNLLKDLKERLGNCIDNEDYHRRAMKHYEDEILSLKESIAEIESLKDKK